MTVQTRYTETKIYTTSAGTEPVEALLMALGIDSVAVEDPADIRRIAARKDPLDWDFIDSELLPDRESVLTFYTERNREEAAILEKVRLGMLKLKADEQDGHYGANVDFGRLYMTSSPLDDSWKEKWKEGFKPFHVTNRFVVRPPWEPYEPQGGEQIISLDPGMAFGTGSHETTALCVAALEKDLRPGDRFMDVGAGSGILSIVGVLLGAGAVTAVELDRDAVRSAEENLARNKMTGRADIFSGDIRDYLGGATAEQGATDVLVANLTSGLIRMLLPAFAKALKAGGKLILSGILCGEGEEMTRALYSAGFGQIRREERGDWMLFCGTRE